MTSSAGALDSPPSSLMLVLPQLDRSPAGAGAIAAVGGIGEAAFEHVLAEEGEGGRLFLFQDPHRGLGLGGGQRRKRLAGAGGSVESSEEAPVLGREVLVVGFEGGRNVVHGAEDARGRHP